MVQCGNDLPGARENSVNCGAAEVGFDIPSNPEKAGQIAVLFPVFMGISFKVIKNQVYMSVFQTGQRHFHSAKVEINDICFDLD